MTDSERVTSRERAQRRREATDTVASEQLLEDYRMTFSTPHGRRVFADIIETGHQLSSTFTGNSWGYFYEGERNWVLRFMGRIPGLAGEILAEILAKKQLEMDRQRNEVIDGSGTT